MSKYLYNKKATFNYEIVDTLSAGIQLHGFEVKSIKTSKGGSLEGSHVIIRNGEAFLVGAHIPDYQMGNTPAGYNSRRERKLLLTKKELERILETEHSSGLTVVPLSLYSKGRYIKADIAIARGKKKYDKRETIKKRDSQRELAREFKTR
ncbi:MAG: SsrA-binding protein SmpB [Candidatus Pacebacteria bacterium]|nr:SsrA-binding protein SmpB [Candidatus Paceibacterota bacterium]